MGGPIEFVLARVMFAARKKGVVLTDQRVRMTSEVRTALPPAYVALNTYVIIAGYLTGPFRNPAHQILRLGVLLCTLSRYSAGTRSPDNSPPRVRSYVSSPF